MADDRLRLNAGYLYAAIYNTAMTGEANREAVQPTDIVPSMSRPQGPPDLRTMQPAEQKNYMFNVFMGSGKRSMR